MSIYELIYSTAGGNHYELKQSEIPLYGSSRLGMVNRNQVVISKTCSSCNSDYPVWENSVGGTYPNSSYVAGTHNQVKNGFIKTLKRTLGEKVYELNNHLGNVQVTVSDRRKVLQSSGSSVSYYKPDIRMYTDYYAFGMEMPGRSFITPQCEMITQPDPTVTVDAVNENFTTTVNPLPVVTSYNASTPGYFVFSNNTSGQISGGEMQFSYSPSGTLTRGAAKNFSVVAGRNYTITFKAKRAATTNGTYSFRVWDANNTSDLRIGVTTLPLTTTYQTFTYTFTATTNGTYMVLFHNFGNGAFTMYVDDLRIYYTDQKAVVSCNSDDGYRFGFNGKEKINEAYGEGNAYDFGARIYDPRIGRWMSVDPKISEFPEWSSYNYCLNSPIQLMDPDGQEPIKPNAGTIAGFIKFFNNTTTKMGTLSGNDAHLAMLRLGETEFSWKRGLTPKTTNPFNTSKDKYIYTEKGGWIDMAHFLFYAGRAYQTRVEKENAQEKIKNCGGNLLLMLYYLDQANRNPIEEAMEDGYTQEKSDIVFAQHSAFSYEDLPSDYFGADFGANYFDPNSDLSLGEQLENYFNNLGAADPKNAPNYEYLPDVDPTSTPSRTNFTAMPVYTKENP